MTRLLAAVLALVLLPGVACSSAAEPEDAAPGAAPSGTTASTDPSADPSDDGSRSQAKAVALKVTKLATGLDHPWDVHAIGHGRYLVTERSGHLTVIDKDRTVRRLPMPTDLIWVSGETGLMGLAIDPDFASNGRFYTCNGGSPQSNPDVRIMVWTLNKAATRATYRSTLLKGFPTSSGRHGGCRLLILDNGAMLVGTGDAAIGTNPENKQSFGGKTLMLNRLTGQPWPTNPFVNASNRTQRYVQTYGHRNVQGLAQRADGSLWSVEHGPDRDDEVNLLKNGGDYGWNPVPGYNESVPMTDQSLPGKQIEAKWSSGFPTVATSGASFLYGQQWGWYDGTLAVAALKAGELLFMKFDASGKLVGVRTPAAMKRYGRLRAVTRLADGSILVTTDNGGNDVVLRVRPAG